MKKHAWLRQALALVTIVGAIGGSYALASSNSFSAAGGAAGDGTGAISGYAVSSPSYTLLGSDPTKITSFTFSISPVTASSTIKAGVVSGTFANSCTLGAIVSGAATATCSYTSGSEPTVALASSLHVIGVN